MRAIIALTALLAGCEEYCTTDARSSVVITVEDSSGSPIPDYTATWSVDGSAPEPCERGVCGVEISGEVTIVADAVGYAAASETVTVEHDGCHPIPEDVTLTLEPVDCTAISVTSLIVDVFDGDDAPVTDATITYALDDGTAGTCASSAESNQHACGEDLIGTFSLQIAAPGMAALDEEVTVQGDEEGCHPLTEEVSVYLAAE